MRLSQAFWQTSKQTSSEAEVVSHQLMIRSGLIHKTASGIYSVLPMGQRVIQKISTIICEEMDRAGAQQMQMAMVTPAQLWQESGRWEEYGRELLRLQDRHDRDMCLSPTNEETVTDIFRKAIKSYKQLPFTLYQINTKFRDEIRPRFGLMRGREFLMKDAYSFHLDKQSLDETYEQMHHAYERIFQRLGLKFLPVEADAGAMAGSTAKTHEFQVLAETGEDLVVIGSDGKTGSNIEKVETLRPSPKKAAPAALEIKKTPNCETIDEVAAFFDIPPEMTLKCMAYEGMGEDSEQKIVLAFVLGSDQINFIKLKAKLRLKTVLPLSKALLEEHKLVPGYIGPFGLSSSVQVVFDSSIDSDSSFVVGANRVGEHATGFVPSRDFPHGSFVDIRLASPGDLDPKTNRPMLFQRGIEVGHIFQLGDKYTRAMKANVLAQNGKPTAPLMGCYGIGVGRTMAAGIEQNHDEQGIKWPKAMAPYQIYFGHIFKKGEFTQKADEIYERLKENYGVLYDDRGVSAGFLFKDSELLGIPIRVVLGEKRYAQDRLLEVKLRHSGEAYEWTEAELLEKLPALWENLP